MNPFNSLENLKKDYKSYIKTFQNFKNRRISDFIENEINNSDLLWQDPIIQISKKFKSGKPLTKFCDEGILAPELLDIFSVNGSVISPYYHQEEAINVVCEKKQNLIVATGTGSGKTLCFEIPIINHCIKNKTKKGIKAIIIYPMNALANSQYFELAGKLENSGFKIGLYTGDTSTTSEDAIKQYKSIFGSDAEPKNSEIISRAEMQRNPPDILVTNYVELELLLTRLDDRGLFPDAYKENLTFLVLDEIHTYRGRRGADVAFLIRRLKQKTNTIGKLICIGTSATMVSENDDEGSGVVVSNFAGKLFGEKFFPENVIREHEDENLFFDGTILNPEFAVKNEFIFNFDESKIETAIPLYESIMGEKTDEITNEETLGKKLKESKILSFIEKVLSAELYTLNELIQKYKKEIRKDFSFDQCLNEILAGLLLGSAGKIKTDSGNIISRFIPKIHSFINQGNELKACLYKGCGYISTKGEIICPECKQNYNKEITLYPLHFCRICGQEYYGVRISKNSDEAEPWSLQSFEAKPGSGYYTPDFKITKEDLPEDWLTPVKKEIREKYKENMPLNGILDPLENKFIKYNYEDGAKGSFIPYKLPFCINCKTEYTGNVNEFTKLFLLNSIGRATGTNVLASSVINSLNVLERKLLGFADNVQDTAFQAGHFKDWYNQILFRSCLNNILWENNGEISIKEIPSKILPLLLGKEWKPTPKNKIFEKYFLRYLETYLYVEIRGTKKFTSQNLEDVGLIEIVYSYLSEHIKTGEFLLKYKFINSYPENLLEEYFIGFLDIFRMEVAIDHPDLINKSQFRQEVINFIEEYDDDKRIFEAVESTKPGCFTDAENARNLYNYKYNPHSLKNSRRFPSWIIKSFGENLTNEQINGIFEDTINYLIESGYITKRKENGFEIYLLFPELISVKAAKNSFKKICPKCNSKYNWNVLNKCIMLKCEKDLIPFIKTHNFYYDMYSRVITADNAIKTDDHSSRIHGDKRKIKENNFKNGDIQFLIATPTMELGIDIGTLSSIYMRNVPPNASNYTQRAGRAGRSGQGALIVTFCGSGPGRGIHDQYFYNNPKEIVSGKIAVPRFNLDNETLFYAHVNSLILQSISEKIYNQPFQFLDFNKLNENIPIFSSYYKKLSESVIENKKIIIDNIKTAFEKEINSSDGTITISKIESQVNTFVDKFNNAFEDMRKDYIASQKEIFELDEKIRLGNQADNIRYQARRKALEIRNENIRNGKDNFNTYRYLSQVGLLPNYAFPNTTAKLKVFHKNELETIYRDRMIALREFAPLNYVYYEGQKYSVASPGSESNIDNKIDFVICDSCGKIEIIPTNDHKPVNCSVCGATFENLHEKPALIFPVMNAQRKMKISSEEEERLRGGYDIRSSYTPSKDQIIVNTIKDNIILSKISFERTAYMNHLNIGAFIDINKGIEGFTYDKTTQKWFLFSETDNQPDSNHNFDRFSLLVNTSNDILTLTVSQYYSDDEEIFSTTLLYALIQSIIRVMELDESEISGFVQKIKNKPSKLIIFETTEGGTGTLSSIINNINLIRKIGAKALEILHYNSDGTDKENACEKACYNCICSYYNQRQHKVFDRKIVKDFLLNLSLIEDIKGGQDDNLLYSDYINRASEFEKPVLKEIKNEGIRMPSELHKVISIDGIPIAEADFFYEPRVCIFVDDPTHDQEHVKYDDEKKRKKLKSSQYFVYAISYLDDIKQKVLELKQII